MFFLAVKLKVEQKAPAQLLFQSELEYSVLSHRGFTFIISFSHLLKTLGKTNLFICKQAGEKNLKPQPVIHLVHPS